MSSGNPLSKTPSTSNKLIKRVFQRTQDPIQRPKTCPPPQPLFEKLSQKAHCAHHDKPINEKKITEKKTVRVPLSQTVEFRVGGEKKRQPPPQPLFTSTSPRPPPIATNPYMGLQSEDDRRRPTSPRNEGFRYPGSDLARRRPSLGPQPARYEDDLPVFNNGIGGGPIQRYPNLEDRYPPLYPGPPTSPTSSSSRPYPAAADPQQQRQQQQPNRTGRPEQYGYSRPP